ncbi:MAG: methionyl-tRNA formyltransferase [Deltaproteobacteria bacterium]|nr:methionyl-tRNA formyltransferase [Deltaproteobacteria bacterium]
MTERLKTVFMGTPSFGVPILEALASETDVRLVVTQPDRPAGRGRKLVAPPVKDAAGRLGVAVLQPESVKGSGFAEEIGGLSPDLIVTAAFGKLMGRRLLATPRLGCLNVHASLLPRHRGAAPVNWAILSGDSRTGVSIMRMDEGLDTGPVLLEVGVDILNDETAGELTERLAALGAETLIAALRSWDRLVARPQDPSKATVARMLAKGDGRVDWTRTAAELGCHVRGMHPWPCASTKMRGAPLLVHAARVIDADMRSGAPGTVVAVGRTGIDVACGRGILRLVELQREGRARMSAHAFAVGARLEAGSLFGD